MGLESGRQTASWLSSAGRARRGVSELVGLARNMLADGAVSSSEVHELVAWIADHPSMINTFPGNVIAQRLERYLADRYIDEDETEDLTRVLAELTRTEPAPVPPESDVIPYTRPNPTVQFEAREFVFAGRFYYGPRKACERAVIQRGGACQETPGRTTHYIVIGTLGATDSSESPFPDIDRVLATLGERSRAVIISEDHWAAHL